MSDFAVPPGGTWLEDLGLVVNELSGARVSATIELGPQHHTPWGVVHGGVYATIVESTASIGASAAVHERGQFAVGLNNSTDFLRSTDGGRLDIVAEPVIQGRTQQLWEVGLRRHADGKLVAQGRVRLQNVPIEGTGG
jgi:uncharacterized protein (TIGR00369 family)